MSNWWSYHVRDEVDCNDDVDGKEDDTSRTLKIGLQHDIRVTNDGRGEERRERMKGGGGKREREGGRGGEFMYIVYHKVVLTLPLSSICRD